MKTKINKTPAGRTIGRVGPARLLRSYANEPEILLDKFTHVHYNQSGIKRLVTNGELRLAGGGG